MDEVLSTRATDAFRNEDFFGTLAQWKRIVICGFDMADIDDE
jgi:hypothetical protein